ncbi:MAG: M81 family metallopeptidase [Clostridia bacterium]
MTKRLVIGQISHETNTFSPIATDLERFAQRSLAFGEDVLSSACGTRTGIGGYIDAAGGDVELIPAVAASAVPSGLVTAEAYGELLRALLETIEEAMDSKDGLDGVALCLHGAMVVEGIDDGEGDILSRVRNLVGPDIPVVASLDLHANMTQEMVQAADALFGYDTNPHVDAYERAIEAYRALEDIWIGRLRPVMHLEKVSMMPPTINMRTAEGPMVELFEMASYHETKPTVRNVSIFGGFPYTDVEFAGLSVLALTDADPDRAAEIGKSIAERAWQIRHQFLKELTPPEEAVRRAMAAKRGPVILADVADNMGGGGSGDTTVLLAHLVEAGARDVGFALMVDPESVARCIEAGPGERVKLSLGGKIGPEHGKPVDCEGTVRSLTDGRFINKGPMSTGVLTTLGKTALVDVDGIEVIVTENRVAPNDPEVFRHVGIEPTDKHILVVKSRGHFRAAYEPFAADIIEVDCPGFASPNLDHFDYRKLRRPIFPLDEM